MPLFLKKYGKTLVFTAIILVALSAAFFFTDKPRNDSIADNTSGKESNSVVADNSFITSSLKEISVSEKNIENDTISAGESLSSSEEGNFSSHSSSEYLTENTAQEQTSQSSTVESTGIAELSLPDYSKPYEDSSKAESKVESSQTVTSLTVTENTESSKSHTDDYNSVSDSEQKPDEKTQSKPDISVVSTVLPKENSKQESRKEESSKQDQAHLCTIGISCETLIDKTDSLPKNKRALIPSDGILLYPVNVTYNEGDSVFDVTKRICMENRIPFEFTMTPIYDTAYIEGIFNLYEFDCGSGSGWVYSVNAKLPSVGCSGYHVCDGDIIWWHYTCELGNDISFPDT